MIRDIIRMLCGPRAGTVANESNTVITRVGPSGDFIASISGRAGRATSKSQPQGAIPPPPCAAQSPAASGHWPAAQMPTSLSLRSRLPILSRIPPAATHPYC